MSELIEREAALAAIDRWAYTQTGWYEHPDLDEIEDAAKAIIRALPIADRTAEQAVIAAARTICNPPEEDDDAPISHVLVPPALWDALCAALAALDALRGGGRGE